MSAESRTTTPVDPEWAVLMLLRNSLSRRKKLFDIRGAVAGPNGGWMNVLV